MEDQLDEKKLRHQAEALRKVAFTGVTISTVAALACIIVVPGLYTYLQHIQSNVQNDVNFCRHRTEGLYEMYERMQVHKGIRPRRQAGYDSNYEVSYGNRQVPLHNGRSRGNGHSGGRRNRFGRPRQIIANSMGNSYDNAPAQEPYGHPNGDGVSSADSAGTCCSCQIGEMGLPGPPGHPGEDGKDGLPGKHGKNSDDESEAHSNEPQFCFECPEPIPGPPDSDDAVVDLDLQEIWEMKASLANMAPKAREDKLEKLEEGEAGEKGKDGKVRNSSAPPGEPGPIGEIGKQGKKGEVGKDGAKGEQGEMGEQGDDGGLF
ncbi:hypothetical protein WR25_10041 [Diploscapter pachys]|uniref:Nematode cuticle collagen N-terminal domain-containing protein n=1 Tax=Diploscapter pachys TaxID=2018661 RepID=A0A2A2JAK4_9BILA|nr:hypothetical protein WR25_10041 [Diploscapter pachys]